jgi:DNA-binding NtrC family response regulator
MPGTMQAKLLRVLESRKIRPVGSDRELPVDARIVTATNKNLAEEVRNGRFREDLYYRLNVVTIKMPTLRQRPEDIPQLVDFLGKNLAAEFGVAPPAFGREDIQALQAYDWPGNVRELRNLIERAVLLGRLPSDIMSGQQSTLGHESKTSSFPVEWTLAEVEKSHMRRVLESAGGNKSEAARRLGISRKTLERKLRSDSAAVQT